MTNLNEFELDLIKRDTVGTSASRELRNDAKVPATLYGKKTESISAYVGYDVLHRALNSKTLFNKLTYLNLGKEKKLAVAKVVQKHPVTDKLLHIDFQLLEKEDVIRMRVPIVFINKELCEVIKLGGLLNVVLGHIELQGKASSMPSVLTIDLTNAKVGVSIKVEHLDLPVGIKVIKKFEEKVVATILAAKKKGSDAADASTESTSAA